MSAAMSLLGRLIVRRCQECTTDQQPHHHLTRFGHAATTKRCRSGCDNTEPHSHHLTSIGRWYYVNGAAR